MKFSKETNELLKSISDVDFKVIELEKEDAEWLVSNRKVARRFHSHGVDKRQCGLIKVDDHYGIVLYNCKDAEEIVTKAINKVGLTPIKTSVIKLTKDNFESEEHVECFFIKMSILTSEELKKNASKKKKMVVLPGIRITQENKLSDVMNDWVKDNIINLALGVANPTDIGIDTLVGLIFIDEATREKAEEKLKERNIKFISEDAELNCYDLPKEAQEIIEAKFVDTYEVC